MTKIEAIKAGLPLGPFLARYTRGLRPMHNRRFMMGLCPFHQTMKDRPGRAKFWVNVEQGLCNCFVPHCQTPKPMDIINFWARLHGISNQEAIEQLWQMVKK